MEFIPLVRQDFKTIFTRALREDIKNPDPLVKLIIPFSTLKHCLYSLIITTYLNYKVLTLDFFNLIRPLTIFSTYCFFRQNT